MSHALLRPRFSCAARAARGFTLLEILVVIVVIGVIVSAATLSVGVLGRDRESEDQARRFWAVLVQVREESELQGLDMGVFISAEGYEFLQFDTRENRWLPVEGDSFLAPRKLPEGLAFRLWLEKRAIVLKPVTVDRSDKDEDKKWPPQLMVLSSGDIMPFELHLERDGQPAIFRIEALPDNDLRLERRHGIEPWELVSQTKPPEDKDRRSTFNKKQS
ncbi:MAG TPA: type II secretion system minor pseudopilin GspH [Povalibacter sp.]